MDKTTILEALTPDIVARFRRAIELGKWDNGEQLTAKQRKTCMQAVMIWEHEYLPVEARIGYIAKPKDNACDTEHEHHYPHESVITIKGRA